NELEIAGASARGELDSFSRGCYVIASRDPEAMPKLQWQVCAVSSEVRHASLRAMTCVEGNSGTLVVRKRGTARTSGVFEFHPVIDGPLFEGHTGAAALLYAIRTGDLNQFITLLQAWVQHLVRDFSFAESTTYASLLTESDVLLRGEALDAIL